MIGILLAGGAALALIGGYGVHRYRRVRKQHRRHSEGYRGESIGGAVVDGVGDAIIVSTVFDGSEARAATSEAFEGAGGSFGGGGASGSWSTETSVAALSAEVASDSASWISKISLPDISLPDIDLSGIELPDIDF
jgi:hypothetical protein